MSGTRQTTLAKPAALRGVGLHNGSPVRIVCHPAAADTGVFFRRDGQDIPARPNFVTQTRLSTRLENRSGVAVQTVEHLLAALVIADIDNAIIDVDNIEIPAVDGSAEPFVIALEDAGIVTLDAPRKQLVVTKRVDVEDGDRFVRIEPFEGSMVNIGIAFDDPAIGRQAIEIDLSDRFVMRRRLARARTFCRLSDIEQMRHAGFARGGSLDNAIVVDNQRVLNETGLSDPVEFALHKALDLIGDFKLLGVPFVGLVHGYKSGHDLHVRALRVLLDTPGAFELRATPAQKAAQRA